MIYHRKPPFDLVGAISVVEDEAGAIDPVTHTDGIDIAAAALPAYPRGLLVVQDDGNPQSGVDQNFKLVDWREVDAAIKRLNDDRPD